MRLAGAKQAEAEATTAVAATAGGGGGLLRSCALAGAGWLPLPNCFQSRRVLDKLAGRLQTPVWFELAFQTSGREE